MNLMGWFAFWCPSKRLRGLIARRYGTPITGLPDWYHVGPYTVIYVDTAFSSSPSAVKEKS